MAIATYCYSIVALAGIIIKIVSFSELIRWWVEIN